VGNRDATNPWDTNISHAKQESTYKDELDDINSKVFKEWQHDI